MWPLHVFVALPLLARGLSDGTGQYHETKTKHMKLYIHIYIYMDIYFYTYVECFSLVSYCSFVLRNIAGISKQCCGIALALKKAILAMAQLYKPLVGEMQILLARIQTKSFWQGFFLPAILLARIQSLSACWIRKSSTAFHRHPYFFSDQG